MTDKISVKSSEANSDEIDFGRILGILLDNRWLIIGVTSIFTTLSLLYVLFATPIYKADAMIQVEQSSGNKLLNGISSMLPEAKPESGAEIELIKSRMVIGKTVRDLSLDTIVEQKYFPIFGKGMARILNNKPGGIALSRLDVPVSWDDETIEIKVLSKTTYEVSAGDIVNFSGTVGKLESEGGITLLVSDINAPVGTIFWAEKSSELSAINKLLDALIVADKGRDTGVLQLSLEGSDPAEIKKILNSISQNYLQQNVERKSEEAGKSLEFLEEQLPNVRNSLNDAENKLNLFRQQNESVDLSLEAKSVLETMVAVESQLNELTFKEAEISKLYTKEHPAYRALMEKRNTLEQERDKLNKRVGGMPKTQQEILRLTRDVQSGQEV
uniref:Wzz/FepE/Etk N-terminal domain-containing protein n=1 Tax=Serratia sp. PL7 TaxID=2952201 RepID=UPI0021AD833C